MVGKTWKVWLMVVQPGREDIVRGLEEAGCQVILGRSFRDSKYFPEDELVKKVPEMDALMITTGELMTRRVMEAATKLRVISKMGRGVEQIDLKAATDLGILVVNTVTESNTASTAEYAVAMILACAKKFKLADHNARLRLWRSVSNILLKNKTVGIIGLGRIGAKVAQLLQPFEVKLVAYDPYVSREKAKTAGVVLTDLETLLRESDFVTLHAVQTPENKRLIGKAQLEMMKPTAYLINAARGGLVDEMALAESLKKEQIAGAALDVFDPEVPDPSNPLLDQNIYLKTLYSPHAAGANPDNDWQLAIVQMENCLKGLRGEVPESVVNPEVVPKWQRRFQPG